MDDDRRLVDLPGYGYAKVGISIKETWQSALGEYVDKRQALKGLILLMDIRHPLKPLDEMILHYAIDRNLRTHILLTKADKVNQQAKALAVRKVRQTYELVEHLVTVQAFSALKKQGVVECHTLLEDWFQLKEK